MKKSLYTCTPKKKRLKRILSTHDMINYVKFPWLTLVFIFEIPRHTDDSK